ncbi:MAG: HdeD family acid-resistance protein [Tabrizicola flagellatus]|uniref:HdeD family acid-resistance protein n=1 Tax=Tabrizicola flagellatus TaxID=2593021 RepID=UPI00391CA9A6
MKNRTLLVVLGIVTVVAGFFAILNPVAGSIAVTILTGWMFLLFGIVQAVAVVAETDWSHRLWSLLLAVLAALAGISLLVHPLAGVISLTYLLAILFVVSGAFKLVAGLGMPASNWKWMVLLSGAMSLVLGIVIFANFGQAAMVTLGLLLGLQLISDGATLLGLVWAARRIERA